MADHAFEQAPNQTLAKAIAVLEAFRPDCPERGIRELSRDLGINAASIHRMVATLANAGYLEQNPRTQRYTLGPKVMRLATLYARENPIGVVAEKVFQAYADRFEYNFYLGKLWQFETLYVAVLDGRGPIRLAVEPGGTVALHATATGKLLLALQSDDYVNAFIARSPLNAYTERTITDPAQLWEHIHRIRAQDYAVNDGELYEDIGAVTVPLFGAEEPVVLGVCLAYPRHLVQQGRIQIPEVLALTREISREIGLRASGLDATAALTNPPDS